MNDCSLCHGVGWVIDCNPFRYPLNAEIIQCPIPDCPYSGSRIEIISVNGLGFNSASYHPVSKIIMSLRR
jgi:hypothetical protein